LLRALNKVNEIELNSNTFAPPTFDAVETGLFRVDSSLLELGDDNSRVRDFGGLK
jgi:hypothetical protein